ncbi:hypothetical protein [Streptomyces sp. LN499]|uniref:hypothetical protein n=1 Tax=Streptomyces sp. LN499 TaxID=3112977 RepID=UPI003719A9C4
MATEDTDALLDFITVAFDGEEIARVPVSLDANEIHRLRQFATAVEADLFRSGLVVRDAGQAPDRQTAPGGLEIDLGQIDD